VEVTRVQTGVEEGASSCAFDAAPWAFLVLVFVDALPAVSGSVPTGRLTVFAS
jgi:hypothetical protein